MKMQRWILKLVVLFLLSTADSTFSQGTVVTRHMGASDPTTEGFTFFTSYGSPQVGPVFNDMGLDAWSIRASSSGGYYYRPIAGLAGSDWILSVNVRIVTPDALVGGGVFTGFVDTGQYHFYLLFGSQADGDPIVRVDAASISPVFVLEGAGSSYHNYQVVFNAATETANLWIDGVERFGGLVGGSAGPQSRVQWSGSYQGSPGYQANWNYISLEIIPEPSTLALLGCGGILLAGHWLRRFRRRE